MALSQREKAMVLVPVAMGGLFLFYSYVHEPLFARKAQAQEVADQTRADLQRDEQRLSKEGDLARRLAAVQDREQKVDKDVPGKNAAALFIWYLSQAELQSGARITGITVGEKKLVTASAAAGAQAGQAAAGQAGQAAAGQAGQGAAPVAAGQPTVNLTMVQLDLKVQARFAEHLLFNQALESMPLFLATRGLALAPSQAPAYERASKMLQEGNPWLAAQILRTSPNLDGGYVIHLYFQGPKPGPDTGVMTFSQKAGRVDPFAMDGVDEFLKILTDYFGNPNHGDDGMGGPAPGQMG